MQNLIDGENYIERFYKNHDDFDSLHAAYT